MSEADKGDLSIPDNAQDLTIFVQNLLEQMVSVFENTMCVLLYEDWMR